MCFLILPRFSSFPPKPYPPLVPHLDVLLSKLQESRCGLMCDLVGVPLKAVHLVRVHTYKVSKCGCSKGHAVNLTLHQRPLTGCSVSNPCQFLPVPPLSNPFGSPLPPTT